MIYRNGRLMTEEREYSNAADLEMCGTHIKYAIWALEYGNIKFDCTEDGASESICAHTILRYLQTTLTPKDYLDFIETLIESLDENDVGESIHADVLEIINNILSHITGECGSEDDTSNFNPENN